MDIDTKRNCADESDAANKLAKQPGFSCTDGLVDGVASQLNEGPVLPEDLFALGGYKYFLSSP